MKSESRTGKRDVRRVLARALLRTKIGRRAWREGGDASRWRRRPDGRVYLGLGLMGFSYVIGWPMVGALGVLSLWLENPWIVAVGGPATYGLSHLLFLLGLSVAGAEYGKTFLLWAVNRFLRRYTETLPQPAGDESAAKEVHHRG